MRFVLVGQPNCGKSTLFNQVAGYKAETGNFHGTTVTFTESKVRVAGSVIELVDLPGTYTLEGTNPAEAEAQRYLASEQVDVIINVVDASHLAQGLELTLELLALNRPLVLALNMMDEAKRTGLRIDGPGLEKRLGIPVLPLIASHGQGILQLFRKANDIACQKTAAKNGDPDTDDDIQRHQLAGELASEYSSQGERKTTWRDRFDVLLLHPFWGYIAMAVILFLFFQIVYGIGSAIEGPAMKAFNLWTGQLVRLVGSQTLWAQLLYGLLQGISGGLALASALPGSFPFRPRLVGGYRLSAEDRLPDGRVDAPAGPAWQGHCAFYSGIWL